MFRSHVEKISGKRIIVIMSTIMSDNFIFFLPAKGSDVYPGVWLLRRAKKEVIVAALNLFFMKTSISH